MTIRRTSGRKWTSLCRKLANGKNNKIIGQNRFQVTCRSFSQPLRSRACSSFGQLFLSLSFLFLCLLFLALLLIFSPHTRHACLRCCETYQHSRVCFLGLFVMYSYHSQVAFWCCLTQTPPSTTFGFLVVACNMLYYERRAFFSEKIKSLKPFVFSSSC